MGIVGVGLHGTYDPAAVDNETRGHRQAPRRIAVADGEVVTEADAHDFVTVETTPLSGQYFRQTVLDTIHLQFAPEGTS